VDDEGRHFAICPACGVANQVLVTHEPDENAKFVLRRDAEGNELEVVYGERAIYDWEDHETHIKEFHSEVSNA
jgi:hypothetical protein